MVRSAAPLPPTPVDLGVRQADALQLVARPDQQDAFHVVGRFGVHDHPAGAVGRAGVRVDEHGPQVREVLDETGLGRSSHVSDGGRVSIARDADHDVGTAKLVHRAPQFWGQSVIGHPVHLTRSSPMEAGRLAQRRAPTFVMVRHSGVRSPGM